MQTIRLAGKTFKAITNSTLGRDVAAMELIHRSGFTILTPTPGESDTEFAARVFTTVSQNGHLFDLLGCLMMPEDLEGSQWTKAVGKQTAEFLATLSSPEDKQVVKEQVSELASFFFLNALLSPLISPRSLTERDAIGRPVSAAHASTPTGVHSSAT